MVEGQLPDPVVVDFVLCDGVSRDLTTGRLSLLGLRTMFKTSTVPVRVSFTAFVRMTNVRKSLPLHFKIVDAAGEVLVESEEADLPKPTDIMQDVVTVIHFPDIELPRHEFYFVQFWRPERYIMERRFKVSEPDAEDE